MLALPNMAFYCNATVAPSQRGIVVDAGRITEVLVSGGPYSGGWYADLVIINVSAQSADWTDVSLVTNDEQPIGLSVNVTYTRSSDSATLIAMYTNFNLEAVSDDALRERILDKLPDSAKSATAQLTLGQMLGTEPLFESQINTISTSTGIPVEQLMVGEGRQLLSTVIEILLQDELTDLGLGVIINDVSITDVVPSAEFTRLLERTANAMQEREAVIEERRTAEEQLESERVQTQIEIEQANRDQQVNAINAEAYDQSPALLQLEMTRILAQAINEGDVIIYVPEGSSLVNVVGGQGVLPITNVEVSEEGQEPE